MNHVNCRLGEEATKLASCEFEGKTYKEGERMYPHEQSCYKCFCTKDFKNVSIRENKDCVKISCNIELLEDESIRNKCIPVYHKDNCCPYDWRCPSKNDAIVPGERHKDSNAPTCKFGNLEFKIGDSLSSSEKSCSKCTCNIPPMLDCVFQPGC